MNNKRIDLTQFEEMPKQMETEWHEHDIYGARYLIKICEPETPWVVGAIVPDFEPHDNYAKDKAEQEKMAKLFAMSPAMVAELKRCYDFIESHGLDEDIKHKMVIDLRECSNELLDELCFQAGVETGTKKEMMARLLE